MARNISVKIPTSVLIANIESKIAEIDEQVANYPALLEQYERDSESYKSEIAKAVSNYVANNASKVGYDYDSPIRISTDYSGRLQLIIDNDLANLPKRPEQPKRPDQSSHYGREYTSQKQLLERNLKILRMTSQEEVSASTYGAIMEIL
jgi:hypothetical protein